jgi:hypothetical protein
MRDTLRLALHRPTGELLPLVNGCAGTDGLGFRERGPMSGGLEESLL